MTYRSDLQGTFQSFIELGSSQSSPVLTLARSPSQTASFQLTLPATNGGANQFVISSLPGILDFLTKEDAIDLLLPDQNGNQDKALLTDGSSIYWGTVTSNLSPLSFTNQISVQYIHNLGRYVNYLILDSSNNAIGGQVSFTLNAITITFNSAISGTLVIF